MIMDKKTAELVMAMVEFDVGDARRIQHFMKVHDFAVTIAQMENISPEEYFILETASILHDIGIHPAEKKYGSSGGKLQEKEGPPEADKMLRRLGGYTEEQIERVKYLIGHHHTYKEIDGMDYQILIEADFLVNLYENQEEEKYILGAREHIFKTKTGLKILNEMFSLPE